MWQKNVSVLLIISFLLLGIDSIPTKNTRNEFCTIEEGIIAGQMDDKVMEEASGLAYRLFFFKLHKIFLFDLQVHSAFLFLFKSLAVKSKIIYYGLKMIMGMTLELLHYPMKVREIQLLLWRVLRMMIGKILLPP